MKKKVFRTFLEDRIKESIDAIRHAIVEQDHVGVLVLVGQQETYQHLLVCLDDGVLDSKEDNDG